MRTTLSIDDDVLAAAKEIGRAEGRTAGQVLSEAFRQARARGAADSPALDETASPAHRRLAERGIVAFPPRGGIVTNEAVNRWRDELGI